MQPLRSLIIEEINRKGRITFAEFMAMALYHPEYGYYNADVERVGKWGDYYTSPAVHGIFGELIAKQLEEMWRLLGEEPFTVVEMGANRGWLCHDIIQCIKKEYPGFYDRFHYIIVESNPSAPAKQRQLLASLEVTDEKVSWHKYSETGFSFGGMQGCFFANEFVDALPVHRLRLRNGLPKELYVCYNGSGFFETEGEASSDAARMEFEPLRPYLKEGQSCEVNVGASRWMRHVSERLRKGFVITIDYGDAADGIYCGGNSDGTVRCFYRHTVNHDYYERPGGQDITSHVNFTALMNAGELVGLKVAGFTKQSHYLIALGILERLNNSGNNTEAILKAKNLFHPEVMGSAFKVLVQHKGVEAPQLAGLRPLRSI